MPKKLLKSLVQGPGVQKKGLLSRTPRIQFNFFSRTMIFINFSKLRVEFRLSCFNY